MTKNEQLYHINNICEWAYKASKKDRLYGHSTPKKFRKCNAETFETKNWIYLRSYSTVVAVINKEDWYGFDFLRLVYGYTATSAQHIRKFFNDYHCAKIYTYRDV